MQSTQCKIGVCEYENFQNFIPSTNWHTHTISPSHMLKPRWNAKKGPALPLYYKDKPKRRSPLSNLTNFMHRYTPHSSKMRLRAIFALTVIFVVYYFLAPSASQRRTRGAFGNVWDKCKHEVKQVFLESLMHYPHHACGNDIYPTVTQAGPNVGTTTPR